MNRPGTNTGNWAFRLVAGALTPAIAERLHSLCLTYDRGRPAA
jgi:4-alpha-glucanotransferase